MVKQRSIKVNERALAAVQKDWHEQHGMWKDLTIRSIVESYEEYKQQRTNSTGK